MRACYVILLVAGDFFANTEVYSMATAPIPSTSPLKHLLIADKNDVSLPRFLRTAAAAREADEERVNFIQRAEKFTNFITAKNLEEKLSMWKTQGKKPEYVFKMMNLHNKKDKLFDSKFTRWVKYTEDMTEDPIGAAVTMLMKHYSTIDLHKVLDAAKKVDATKDLATKLHEKLGEVVLRESIREVPFNRALETILTDPVLKLWSPLNNEDSSPKTALINVLLLKHNDDALFRNLNEAKKTPTIRELAEKLQQQQIESWPKRKARLDDIFRVLGLQRDEDNLLSNPNFQIWANYVKANNADLIEALLSHYAHKKLFDMLEVAKKDHATSDLAKKLQQQQREKWLRLGLGPGEVFKVLGLKDKAEGLINTKWRVWTDHMDQLLRQQKGEMTKAMMNSYKNLWKTLQTAKTLQQTEKTAIEMQAELHESWLQAGVSLENVSWILGSRARVEGSQEMAFLIAYRKAVEEKQISIDKPIR